MKRMTTSHLNDETDRADRLALTGQDRRLESRVLLDTIQGAGREREQPTPPITQHVGGGNSRISEDQIRAHAARTASFLSAEFGLETLDQMVFVSELAVEVALRIAEEIGGVSKPESE